MNKLFERKEIYLTEAGTLANNITEQEKNAVTDLKISGYINSADFSDVLSDMCTCYGGYFDEYDNHFANETEPPFLKGLDLGDCEMTGEPVIPEFTYYAKLEIVVLPQKAERIGGCDVFRDLEYLHTVVLPKSLKEIGAGVFMGCAKLKTINLPDSLEQISDFAFCNCKSLTAIKIPANVSDIGFGAFCACDGIEQFELDENNKHFTLIDGVIFNKETTDLIAFPCGYKSTHYAVPEGVKTIGRGAFYCANIETISLPESLEIIGEWAFRWCTKLQSLLIPDSVTDIGAMVCEACYSLNHVKLPNKLTILKEDSFAECTSLFKISIPTTVKTIERYAFHRAGGNNVIKIERINNPD